MCAARLRFPILVLCLMALGSGPTRGDDVYFVETADWVPTASIVTVPTSYVLTPSVVVPTAYVIPTAYSTAYVTETALVSPVVELEPTYYETRFRRRGLFGRRLEATTRAYSFPTTAYYPTTFYYPTVYSAPAIIDRAVVPTEYVATTATTCCGEVIRESAPAVVRSAPTTIDRPATSAPERSQPPAATRSRSAPLESEPDDDSISSDVEQNRATSPSTSNTRPSAQPQKRGTETSPPAPQAAERESTTAARPEPNTSAATPKSNTDGATKKAAGGATGNAQTKGQSGLSAPKAPSGDGTDLPEITPADGDQQLFPAPETDAASKAPVRRDSQRPVLPAPRTVRSEYRNVLVGIVRSRDSDEPEDGVRLTITNRDNSSVEKFTLSNAFGKFAVRVPDGEWTVKVTMPSGRVYPVRELSVRNGEFFDESGRDVPSLIITR